MVAEKKRFLTPRREMSQQPANVGQKPHVEHAIGLVEHQHFEIRETGIGLFEVVQQAARTGDDQVDALSEGLLLRTEADAAIDRRRSQVSVTGKTVEMFDDLGCELAGGSDHQGSGRTALSRQQPLLDRQQEGGGLAAARHGASQQIAALETGRNGIALNRRRVLEIEIARPRDKLGCRLKAEKLIMSTRLLSENAQGLRGSWARPSDGPAFEKKLRNGGLSRGGRRCCLRWDKPK